MRSKCVSQCPPAVPAGPGPQPRAHDSDQGDADMRLLSGKTADAWHALAQRELQGEGLPDPYST